MAISRSIDAASLEQRLEGSAEIALLDVREAGEFANGHLFFATSAPLSLFEVRLLELAPRLATEIVLIDDGHSGRAEKAAILGRELGYSNIRTLTGGCEAWQKSGRELFEGVYVPSKAFGEIVEHEFHVPSISPLELARWFEEDKGVIVLDGRPFDEHRKMNIPGSICLPNGELAYRVASFLHDETTPVVVHCAGRTRSIVGAQILRESGLPNPIFALENGTQGWTLSGLTLERGSNRTAEQAAPFASETQLSQEAHRRAVEWGIPFVAPDVCAGWLSDGTRTTYYLDVRTKIEFMAAHPEGARHAPGGQLLQSTDTWLAVRGARVVLVDDTEVRAVTVARWLRLMGWDACVLDGGSMAWPRVSPPPHARLQLPEPSRQVIDPSDMPSVIDVRSSMAYRAAHIDGAQWMIRSNLAGVLHAHSPNDRLGICGEDGDELRLVLSDLAKARFRRIEWYGADPQEWADAGCRVVATAGSPTDQDAIDFVFFTHDRHSGNLDAARQYLAWETGLVDRLNNLERSSFNL